MILPAHRAHRGYRRLLAAVYGAAVLAACATSTEVPGQVNTGGTNPGTAGFSAGGGVGGADVGASGGVPGASLAGASAGGAAGSSTGGMAGAVAGGMPGTAGGTGGATNGASGGAGVGGAGPKTPGPLPCDIYGAAATPCVAAYSTVRALYGAYQGPLYQVQRASDHATTNIGLIDAGGYANAIAQDAFCASAQCNISMLYDQSPRHNDLTVAGPGAAGPADRGAPANALPITAAGHPVYGVYVTPGIGYRHAVGAGIATNGQPEGMYMVASGTNVNNDCCFDFGNVEAAEVDTGASHMDALTLSFICGTQPCSGAGPWVQADLENGLFLGHSSNLANLGNPSVFVTATLKNDGQTTFALRGGNAQAGALSTWFHGALPAGYAPMHQEGSIVVGTGGDNSNRALGSFFEGVMTSGFPSDAADDAVQANVVSVGYAGLTGAGPGAVIIGPSGKCVDVAGDDVGGNGSAVQLSDCVKNSADQHWTRNADNTLRTLGRCLDVIGNGTAAGSKLELWDCNGVGGQVWLSQPDGSVKNPQSGLCLDDPSGNTTNGTQLQLWTCNGLAPQKFSVAGTPIVGPGGKCVDVAGNDTGGNGALVVLGDCVATALDQHWTHNTDNTLRTLGRCLDIDGNGSAPLTKVELWDCNGVGGQVWVTQPDGSLQNPQSGLCLDDPGGDTTSGIQLQIWNCNGAAPQKFAQP